MDEYEGLWIAARQHAPNLLGAKVHASARRWIAAPPERVWQVLVDVADWPTWNRSVTTVRAPDPIRAGSQFEWKADGLWIRSQVQHFEPCFELVWTGETFGTKALHCWRLVPSGEGSEVWTAEAFGGWLPRLAPSPMRRMLAKALDKGLAALASRMV